MNSTDQGDEAPPAKKADTPPSALDRSSARQEEDRPPAGEKVREDKEGWVHTPSGLRPARIFSRTADSTSGPIAHASLPASGNPVTPGQTAGPAHVARDTSLATRLVVGAIFILGVLLAFKVGESRSTNSTAGGQKASTPAAVPLPSSLSPQEYLPALDIALELLHNGKSLQALDFMNKLMAAHPDAPSLEYATAIAAFQAGFPKEADRLADVSIKKGIRVPDSWILKATIASSQSEGAAAKQESLLRAAIAADPMNPDGFIELASLLRYLGKNAEASAMLSSAALRIDASNAQAVVETLQAILAVDLSDKMVPVSEPIGIPSKDIPNAYSEMKRGNFANAAVILRYARDHMSPQLFGYLVNDPSLKKFSTRPELKEFY